MKFAAIQSAGLLIALIALAGCTTTFRNGQTCKQKMVETYPSDMPKLSYSIPRPAIHGTRVLVEAVYPYQLPVPLGVTLIKTTSYDAPAAVQCEFDGEKMTSFAWLSPPPMNLRYPLTKESEDSPAN